MNKFLFLLSYFLFSLTLQAQQEINTSFKTQMNTMYGPLEKNRVPHGILLDFGMEFTNVAAYNGTLSDTTYSTKANNKYIYNTLLSSRIQNVTNGFVSPQEYETRWKNNRTAGVIALSGMFFKYSQFAPNALSANKLTYLNNMFYDKYNSNVWQNPYQEMQVFAIASPITKYAGYNMQVKIPSNIFYSNYQSLVQSIQIDFGNGAGYVNVPLNQNVAVAYTTAGVKTWKYKLTLTNNTVLYNHSRIKIEKGLTTVPFGGNQQSNTLLNGQLLAGSQAAPDQPPGTPPVLYSHEITASLGYNGGYASARITIDLAAGHTTIQKPLIVAEGFDLGSILSPESLNGMNDYEGFRKSVQFSSSTALRNLIWTSNKQYDIIYVDWNNGVDFLQKNAYALEAVINWVNSIKVGTEKNVVLGQSMGGVIARYALADMEERGQDHKTRLFVSDDAPQQGANIPVSIQYLYRHLTNQYIQTSSTLFGSSITVPLLQDEGFNSDLLSILDVPATRQLLKNYSNLSYGIDNNMHDTFYNELKIRGIVNAQGVKEGYPVNCRNVAISNGSECGLTQNFNPGEYLVAFSWDKGLTFGGDLLSLVYMPLGAGIAGMFVDNDFFAVQALSLVPGRSRWNVLFEARAMPYGAGNQIYNGVVSYTKKVFFISKTVNITSVQKSQPAGILPLDTYGGGYFSSNTLSSYAQIPSLYIRDRFDFIPTASSLDIGKRNLALNDNDYKMAYIGATPPPNPKSSPFVNFATEFDRVNPNASNKPHISFNVRNGDWLAGELNGGTNITNTDCSYMCSGAKIIGADILCDTETFSVPGSGTFYNWTITQGQTLATITGNGTPNVTLTINGNAAGYLTLSVSMGDNDARCGNITLPTKTIWVGAPVFGLVRDVMESETCDIKYHYVPFIIRLPQDTNIDFLYLNPGVTYSSTGDTYTFKFLKTYSGSLNVIAVASNECGSYYYETQGEHMIGTCASIGLGRPGNTEEDTVYKVYPNPSTYIVNVELKNQNLRPVTDSQIGAILYNSMGEQKVQVDIINNIASINVSGLLKGIYILKINIDGVIETHHVAVQ